MRDVSNSCRNEGVALVMVIFVTALLSAVVIGLLQINTEEIQIAENQIHAAEALAIAEAGLNAALAELRSDPDWTDGFNNEAFAGGFYTVTVDESEITSTGQSAAGFTSRVVADVSVGSSGPPYAVAIDDLTVNE
jgi:type II secretory pathway component PulK